MGNLDEYRTIVFDNAHKITGDFLVQGKIKSYKAMPANGVSYEVHFSDGDKYIKATVEEMDLTDTLTKAEFIQKIIDHIHELWERYPDSYSGTLDRERDRIVSPGVYDIDIVFSNDDELRITINSIPLRILDEEY